MAAILNRCDRRVYTLPTPGAPNNQEGARRADEYLRAVNASGVYISEVLSSAGQVRAFADASPCDYVRNMRLLRPEPRFVRLGAER